MELIDPRRATIERGYFWFQLIVLVGAGICSLFFLGHVALASAFSKSEQVKTLPTFRYASIGEGPLALGGHKTPCPVKGLPEEVTILGINNRPDAPREDVPLLMGLKSTQQNKMVMTGQVIRLAETAPGVFSFSDEGSIQLVPYLLDKKMVSCEVEGGSFTLKPASSRSVEDLDYMAVFQKAEVHSPDLLLRNYGGHEYEGLAEKVQLDFGGNVCFVKEGDRLVWDGQMWQEGSGHDVPVAEIRAATSSGVEVEVWDETGFRDSTFAVPAKALPRTFLKLEETLTSLRPKASREITCLLGKRRVVLKAGDWWLKTATGFKNIRRLQDIEDVLYHRLQGELFIFDEVTSEKGKMVVRGTYFDPTHTQVQPIAMTATSEKKTTQAARQRKAWKKSSAEEGPMARPGKKALPEEIQP